MSLPAAILSVIRNEGGGDFAEAVHLETWEAPDSLVPFDFERDDDMDLAVVHYSSGHLSIVLNAGDGTFAVPVEPRLDQRTQHVAAGDLDDDGDPDLVTAGLFVTLLWNASGPPVSTDCDANGVPDECDASPCTQVSFVRGDGNDSGLVDISDAVNTLGYLFLGSPPPPCLGAADVNLDRKVDIADPVYTLTFLFGGGPAIPPPHPSCGIDAAPESMSCSTYSHCR